MRTFPKRFALPAGIKVLRVEHNVARQSWMIWLMANINFTLGTFIELHNDGNIDRVTWHEDGSESVFEVTDQHLMDM